MFNTLGDLLVLLVFCPFVAAGLWDGTAHFGYPYLIPTVYSILVCLCKLLLVILASILC